MCVSIIWLYIYDTQTYTICWYMYIHTWHVYTWFVVDYFLWSQQWEQRISDWYLFSFKAFLTLQYPRILWRITRLVPISGSNCFLDQRSLETMPVNIQFRQDLPCTNVIQIYGYGSIPINTIFRGMNIHFPAILMFTWGTRIWHTAKFHRMKFLLGCASHFVVSKHDSDPQLFATHHD
jgi:hypothetical protein